MQSRLTKAEADLLSKLAGAPYGSMSHYFLGFPSGALLRRLDAAGYIDEGDIFSGKPPTIRPAGRAALAREGK